MSKDTGYTVLVNDAVTHVRVGFTMATALARIEVSNGRGVVRVRRTIGGDLAMYKEYMQSVDAILRGTVADLKVAQDKAIDASVLRWKMRRHLEGCTLCILSRNTYHITARNMDAGTSWTVYNEDKEALVRLCSSLGIEVKEDWTMKSYRVTNGKHQGA